MISSFVRPNESFEFERYFLSITTMSNLKILIISITFTIQAKTSVERAQMGFRLVWMSKFHLIAFQIKLADLLDTLNRWFLLELWKFSKLLEFSDFRYNYALLFYDWIPSWKLGNQGRIELPTSRWLDERAMPLCHWFHTRKYVSRMLAFSYATLGGLHLGRSMLRTTSFES